MFCPNCGNECMDEDVCAHCGQELHSFIDIITNDKLDALVGRYEGIDGYIDLSYFTITIHKVLFSKTFEHTIPFHELADVVFQPASATVDGYLSFREHTDSTTRVETVLDAGIDEKSIVFDMQMNDVFHKISTILKSTGDQANTAAEELESSTTDDAQVVCPNCKSTNWFINRMPYTRIRKYDILVFRILSFILRIAYNTLKVHVCLDCGCRWREKLQK